MYWRGWDSLRLAGKRVVVGQSVDSGGISGDMIAETLARFLFFSWKIIDIYFLTNICLHRAGREPFLPDTSWCSEIETRDCCVFLKNV